MNKKIGKYAYNIFQSQDKMACTDVFVSVIDPLIPFLDSPDIGICDTNIKKHLSTLDRKEFDIMMSMITGQKSMVNTNSYFSIYKINIHNKQFAHVLDVHDNSGDEHQTTIQCDDNHLVLHIFSPESIIFCISDIKSRYVFFPVSLSSEIKKKAHQTSVIIDTSDNNFYLYDPNGKSSYFNDMFVEVIKKNAEDSNIETKIDLSDFYFDGHELVNILMDGYVNDINGKFGTKYKFVKSSVWNPTNKVINPTFDKNVIIGSGHCVIMTILFLHYLHITSEDIKETFEKLGNLKSEELIYLINAYGFWVYQTLKPLFDKKMLNPKYKKTMDELQI